jgi:hypothetical protein
VLKVITTVIFALVAFSALRARAETPFPVAGPLYSDSDNAILVFVCQPPIGNRMSCAFTRTKIWKKENTCSLTTIHHEAVFSRATKDDVWSNVSEPDSLCGEITVSSFENSADQFRFWTFKTRNVETKKLDKMSTAQSSMKVSTCMSGAMRQSPLDVNFSRYGRMAASAHGLTLTKPRSVTFSSSGEKRMFSEVAIPIEPWKTAS